VGPALRDYGKVFDQVADAYDAVRSGYPDRLVDLAVERGGLTPGSRVVEIGSGTGKLTASLVARGLVVDAVEPGANMTAAARRRIGDAADVTFHLARFEDVELPEKAFSAVFSATAFHWVDPGVGWAKAAALLEPGGLLAFLVYASVRTPESAAFEDELLAVLAKHAPDAADDRHPSRELEAILGGVAERRDNVSAVWDWLMSSGRHGLAVPAAAELFDDVQVESDLRVAEDTTDELIALFKTTSLWFRVPAERRGALEADDRALIERHGGVIRTPVATFLMTARRR
jgi:ubiquinone/menaquinone biosynthesis C-methylase UbiE